MSLISKNLKDSLKGVFDGEIKMYDVDNFLQQQGVLVDIHASRVSGRATLNPKLYGVDISKDEELSSFRNEYVKDEKISFIPKSLEKKFITIEASTRIKRKEFSIGFEGRYMPIQVFKEFSIYVKEQQIKYTAVMNEVLEQWDVLRESFIQQLDIMLDKLGAIDKQYLKASILSKAPSKEKFKDSCSLDMEVLAFPTSQNLSILDDSISDEVRETLEKKSLGTVFEILGTILEDSFNTINSVMAKYDETGVFKGPTLNSVIKLRERISKRNIFRHPVIIKLEERLNLSKYGNDDEIMEALEESCVLIYAFSKTIENETYIDLSKSFLPEKVLNDLSLGLTF